MAGKKRSRGLLAIDQTSDHSLVVKRSTRCLTGFFFAVIAVARCAGNPSEPASNWDAEAADPRITLQIIQARG